MEKYDLIIVGAGPAGIFTAVELLRHGSKKHILLVEKGKPVEKRHCPKAELGLSLIHISEPTRRTPISYAVFCLKKKKAVCVL